MNSVYIEITNVCNLHCSFCPCGKENQAKSNPDTNSKVIPAALQNREFMQSDLFEKCIAGAQEIGATQVYFHVLGEPTLHPGFGIYLKRLESTPLKLTLTTNGTTIERMGKHLLQSPALRQVNFSTHAYAELPQSEAEENLQNVLDFCQMAIVERPDLFINLRLWNVGDESSSPWNKYLLDKVNRTFNTNVEPGHFCSRHKSFNITGRLYLHEDSRFEWPEQTQDTDDYKSNSRKYPKGTCHALDTHVAILHDGRVVACCLDYSGQITLGHIQEQSLGKILSQPMAMDLHEGFENHQLRHPFCMNCTYCKRFK